MAKRKRNAKEREKDLQVLGRLEAMGCTVAEMHKALNEDRAAKGLPELSKTQMQYDLKDVREKNAEVAEEQIRLARGRRMAQLDLLYQEAFRAWHRSRQMTKSVTEVSSPRKSNGQIVESQKVKKEVRDIPGGDSRLILAMVKIIELQTQLGGLQNLEAEKAYEEHPPLLPELNSLEDAHRIMERVMGSRHRRSGRLLLWRGRDRKLV